jgi:antitoxin ParD1/3/4
MNISLTPELEKFIQAKVAEGFYHSASEVVREGLRMLAEQDEMKKKRIEMLNAEIEKGLESMRNGNMISGREAMEHIKNRREQYKKQNLNQ